MEHSPVAVGGQSETVRLVWAMRLYGIPPLVAARPTVLVLGSFPSVRSLELRCYYGHPRNHFWPILARCFERPLPPDYPERAALAISLGVAIWDVIASCDREGSLDQAIQNAEPNDIESLLRAHDSIERVLINGSAAAAYFKRFGIAVSPGIELRALPSTSPVPSRRYRVMEDKLEAWREGYIGESGVIPRASTSRA